MVNLYADLCDKIPQTMLCAKVFGWGHSSEVSVVRVNFESVSSQGLSDDVGFAK